MRTDLMSPERIAMKYDGNKQKIAAAVQAGILDPTSGVLAGMFIDRMRAAAAQEQAAKTTVEQDVLGAPQMSAALGATPEADRLAQGQSRAMQAMPPAESGVAALPVDESMVPSEGYAGGGIVAFAGEEGSLVGEGDPFADVRGGKRRNPLEDIVAEQALRLGQDPKRAVEIFYLESGALKNAERAISPKGATGLMQIMPSTAMNPGYGVPNIFDLAKQQGIEFKDQSKSSAEQLLKNPELNAQFGSMYRTAMEQKFGGDPRLAAAAYNAGARAVERAGGVPNYPETLKYVAGISPQRANFIARQEAAAEKMRQSRREQLETGTLEPQGPIIPAASVMEKAPAPVRDFGSEPFPLDQPSAAEQRRYAGLPSGSVISQGPPRTREDLEEAAKRTLGKPRDATVRPDLGDILYGRKGVIPASPKMAEIAERQRAEDKVREELEKPTKKTDAEGTKKEGYGEKLERLLSEREGRLAAQREEDKNLAILAAGLGIMSGRSPYALQNIGAGAMKGIEQYGAARKLARQEEEDILAGRLGQYRYGEESRLRAEDKRLNQGMTLASLEEKRVRDDFNKVLENPANPRNKALQELIKANPNYIEQMAIQARNRILEKYGVDTGGMQQDIGSMIDFSSIPPKKK